MFFKELNKVFLSINFSQIHNMTTKLSFDNSTAIFKDLKTLHYVGIRTMFCSGDVRNDHYATPPGLRTEQSYSK
jgi:hypothetical protein